MTELKRDDAADCASADAGLSARWDRHKASHASDPERAIAATEGVS